MRPKTKRHLYLETLSKYSTLNSNDQQLLQQENRGYQGEYLFEEALKKLAKKASVVSKDLSLKIEQQKVQIDFLLTDGATLYVTEIKNYTPDMIYTEKGWFTTDGQHAYHDPTAQTMRATTLIRNLLQANNIQIPVAGLIIFINDLMHVTLKATPPVTVLMKSQIHAFIKDWSAPTTSSIEQLNRLLLSYAEDVEPFTAHKNLARMMPICQNCGNILKIHHRTCSCFCGKKFTKSEIYRTLIQDLSVLFPNKMITYRFFKEKTRLNISSHTFYKLRTRIL